MTLSAEVGQRDTPPSRADQISAQVKTFPGMPGAAVKLLAVVDDPDVTVNRIDAILRLDPGLTANVLKLANSAYFGIPTRVGSVRQAVMLLGVKRLTHMVIAACASTLMDCAVPGYDLPPGELWRHSLAVSVAAQGLVRELRLDGGEEIFTAALLHDVGKIVLGRFLHDGYDLIKPALDQGLSFLAAESIVLGTTHAEIGARVLAQWALPEPMVRTVRWHHAPEESGTPDTMLDIVHVANMLCLMIGIGVGREGLHYLPSPVVTRRLGLSTGHLERVASHTLQWVSELAMVLDTGHCAGHPRRKAPHRMGLNILIVDDSVVMRSMIRKTMELSGLALGEIYQAANGSEGLDALEKHWIDLVIADINMPVMDGEEMIARMQTVPEFQAIPTIVVSTEGSRTRIERLERRGVRFIHKPFSPEKIRDAVKDVLENRGIHGSGA